MQALISDARSGVEFAEVGEPQPTAEELVVEVGAISVNRGETMLLESPRPGWRPGKDVAGVVVRAAADGSGPVEGTRVVGHAPHSGWAERVAIASSRVVELPDSVSTQTAAALPLAGLTALRLARQARLSPGTTVLMTGASGGVGHYFAELAGAAAARLTAVIGAWERGAGLRSFGARTVLDVTEAAADPGLPGGFDVGLDSIGGDSLGQVRQRVSPRGQVIWFGQAGRIPATLNFFDWVEDTVGAPITQFDYMVSERSLARDLSTLVGLVADGRLHPALDAVRPLNDVRAAIEDLRQRRVVGNLVLTWG